MPLRSTPPTAALLLFLLSPLAACGSDEDTILEPEVESSYGFESGLGAWSFGSDVTTGGRAGVEVSANAAWEGEHSARLSLEDPVGGGMVWLRREFDLSADRGYEAALSFQLGSSDDPDDRPWLVAANVGGTDPGTLNRGQALGLTNLGAAGQVAWGKVGASFPVTAGPDGRIVLLVGVAAEGAGERVYFVDDVSVSFTRR